MSNAACFHVDGANESGNVKKRCEKKLHFKHFLGSAVIGRHNS